MKWHFPNSIPWVSYFVCVRITIDNLKLIRWISRRNSRIPPLCYLFIHRTNICFTLNFLLSILKILPVKYLTWYRLPQIKYFFFHTKTGCREFPFPLLSSSYSLLSEKINIDSSQIFKLPACQLNCVSFTSEPYFQVWIGLLIFMHRFLF